MRLPFNRLWLTRGITLCLLLLFLSLAACSNLFPGIQPADITGNIAGTPPTITLTPFQPQSTAPTNSLAATLPPTEAPQQGVSITAVPTTPASIPPSSTFLVWVDPGLPPAFQEEFSLPAGFNLAETPEQAQLQVSIGDSNPVSHWIYSLVTPFPTIPEGVSFKTLKRAWQGESDGPFAGRPILLDESTLSVFSSWWGPPAQDATKVLPAGKILQHAWEHRPAWALVPFEALEPRWKVLEIDDQSPLRKEFNEQGYPLSVPFSINGDPQAITALAGENQSGASAMMPASNRHPNRLTTVAVTGVTALVRATAFTMHRNGITYPAEDIGGILKDADLTHISNEIPFTPDCPAPDPTQAGLRFCSDPDYIGLLEEVGTDIVELTGDHFGDWGSDAMLYTLEMYDQRDWEYYGGGYNRKDARKALLIEHNGNRLAFIGCNAKGGGYATASETQPGAVSCDYDWMHKEIKRLVKEGYQVIVTFQHFEYYTYAAQPDQIRDFQGMAEAGAVIVSGSQAHQPQSMEFHKKAFIHYGLGNLFFDQYHFCTDNACDDGFINRHVFYDGRYISTELIPIVFIDYARPRPMTPEERAQFLRTIFTVSGW